MKDIITKDGNENIYIDLSNISHDTKGKRIWKESLGKTFIIGYNDEYIGEFRILDYDIVKHIITIQSLDNDEISTITTTGIYNCNIDKKVKPFLKHKYKLNIPMNITDYNRNLTLIDTKIKKIPRKINNKIVECTYEYYLYHCNICGNEDWIKYEDLMNWQHSGCNVCANKKILIGYNDIPTTDPWMVDFFSRRV